MPRWPENDEQATYAMVAGLAIIMAISLALALIELVWLP